MTTRAERTIDLGAQLCPTRSGLHFSVRRSGHRIVVDVSGTLDQMSAAPLDRILFDLIADQGNMHLEIDLSGVEEFDAPGLAVLVSADRYCRSRNSHLCLSGVPFCAEGILRSLTSVDHGAEAGDPPHLLGG